MISRPAIEPAISTLPVKNQLIANVSSVPTVRQLMALRIDLECVSAPRNKTTRRASSTYRSQNLPRATHHQMLMPEYPALQNHPWTLRVIACILVGENLQNSLI